MPSRFLPAAVATCLLLSACGDQTASAPTAPSLAAESNAPRDGSTTTRQPIEFVLSTATCPELPADIRGKGISTLTVRDAGWRSGSRQSLSRNLVEGTAVGSDGSRYRFRYLNTTLSPTDKAPPYEVVFDDQFALIGKDKAPTIQVHQFYRFIVNADGTFTDLEVRVSGNPGCDPI
jgi:hypothetical protein